MIDFFFLFFVGECVSIERARQAMISLKPLLLKLLLCGWVEISWWYCIAAICSIEYGVCTSQVNSSDCCNEFNWTNYAKSQNHSKIRRIEMKETEGKKHSSAKCVVESNGFVSSSWSRNNNNWSNYKYFTMICVRVCECVYTLHTRLVWRKTKRIS